METFNRPVWKVDGKSYKSVAGLCNYLSRKHAASSISGIGADRILRVKRFEPVGATYVQVAQYHVSAPEIGKPMLLASA